MKMKFHISGTVSTDVTKLFITFILRNTAVYAIWNNSYREGTTLLELLSLFLEKKATINQLFAQKKWAWVPFVDTVVSIFKDFTSSFM